MKTYTLHANTAAYLASANSVRYMARLNAQPAWKRPAQVTTAATRDVPAGHGGKRACRRLRHQSGCYFESITRAAEAFGMSDATIRKCLDEGWPTAQGRFYDITEAEWQAHKEGVAA